MALLIPLTMASCTTTSKSLTVTTKPVNRNLVKQDAPRDMELGTPKFYVVTSSNYLSFKERFEKEQGKFILYVLSEKDYKVLLKNQAELKRYIDQQKQIIVYYEKVL